METPTAAAQVTGNKRDREEEEQQATNEDDDEVVTLSDVLKHNEQMTETADAVLGDASDTHCSYPMGYMRQAVYACMTCTPDAREKPETRAGVCLACTYNCHQDHELVELYTKRSFRCDCGNEKFPKGNPCKLEADKAPTNPRNTPVLQLPPTVSGPERTTPEIMVQCVICEDWLHEEHIFKDVDEKPSAIQDTATEETPASAETDKDSPDDADAATDSGNTVPPESFDELICLECMKKHPFLMAYTVDSPDNGEETPAGNGEDSSKAKETDTNECVLQDQRRCGRRSGRVIGAMIFAQCTSCVSLFEKHGIVFLLDPEDSLHVYEATAREKKTASDEEIAQRAFANTLTHEQQVEVAMGYSLMKNNLQQYLAGFAATGKTVRKEDIQNFFETLSQAKRQKTE
ncbi:Zinc finger, UBR-type [Phytophthora cactorum]|nr:Zinc finger, UBR-type [Phytophthora cactorum]